MIVGPGNHFETFANAIRDGANAMAWDLEDLYRYAEYLDELARPDVLDCFHDTLGYIANHYVWGGAEFAFAVQHVVVPRVLGFPRSHIGEEGRTRWSWVVAAHMVKRAPELAFDQEWSSLREAVEFAGRALQAHYGR